MPPRSRPSSNGWTDHPTRTLELLVRHESGTNRLKAARARHVCGRAPQASAQKARWQVSLPRSAHSGKSCFPYAALRESPGGGGPRYTCSVAVAGELRGCVAQPVVLSSHTRLNRWAGYETVPEKVFRREEGAPVRAIFGEKVPGKGPAKGPRRARESVSSSPFILNDPFFIPHTGHPYYRCSLGRGAFLSPSNAIQL